MADNLTPLEKAPGPDSPELLEHDGIEFGAIEAAVLETPRGRWFLREYARRVRAQDHDRLEAVLARIEARLSASADDEHRAPTQTAGSVPEQLVDLARALRRRGVSEQDCAHIENQARALMEAASRRDLAGAVEALEKGFRQSLKTPAA